MTSSAVCPCTGTSLPRLLRPGIMAILAQGEAHGYQIAQHLSAMRMFAERKPDHPGIYRALRRMADEGMVTSSWATGETGPAKRRYALTKDGAVCLKRWAETLEGYRAQIDGLLVVLNRDARPPRSGRARRCKRRTG